MKRVLVAMSGGVDSSVAAYLLREAGYECVGVTMRLYENEMAGITRHTCCSLDDVDDARSVAYRLGMEYHVFDFSQQFEEKVIRKFVDAYEKGWTPNPCIDCNRYLKFDHLLQRAEELDCDFIATGHYAQIVQDAKGRYLLKKGADAKKDQTYALYHFSQSILARTLLPVGALEKSAVRAIAQEQGFINAKKHDSQDICFVPDGDYVGFLQRYLHKEYAAGDLVDVQGRKRGRHRGAVGYTIGQRRGLGVADAHPLYVYEKEMKENIVRIGPEFTLYAKGLLANDWNWLVEAPTEPLLAKAKIRYGAQEQPCQIETQGKDLVRVWFEEPQRAIAPGQSVVVYRGDWVLGGGTIVQVLREETES